MQRNDQSECAIFNLIFQQQAAYDSNQAANQARQLSNQEFQNPRVQSNNNPSSPGTRDSRDFFLNTIFAFISIIWSPRDGLLKSF